MSSLMRYTLSVLFCVLPPTKLHMSDSLVSYDDRPAGASIPTCLATPRLVYIKRQVRTSKMDPLVDKVELLQASPFDTCVGVKPDAEPSSAPEPQPEPQPELMPLQNVEPAPVRRSQRVRRPVVRLDL